VRCFYAAGDVGWLGIASTLAEFRGRGAQSALLAARVARAHRLGLRLLVTETETSYGNVLRAGFGERYVRPNYLRPA
jgi:GNAT superfamily N-acetyltransferase